jgi:hypothetical protein
LGKSRAISLNDAALDHLGEASPNTSYKQNPKLEKEMKDEDNDFFEINYEIPTPSKKSITIQELTQ